MSDDPKTIAADIARELRANPEAWTKGCYARGSSNEQVEAHSSLAQKWCLAGHIMKRCPEKYWPISQRFREAIGLDKDTYLSMWNDGKERTVDEVIAACEKVATS